MRKNSRKAKQEIALALAVSLWIAGGSVAGAETTVTVESGETTQYVYNGEKTETSPSSEGEKTGYHTVINGGTVSKDAYGGYSSNSSVSGNSVTINGGTVSKDAHGGYSSNSSVSGNSVTMNSGSVRGIYGGYIDNVEGNLSLVANSCNNITITGGTVTGKVWGGSFYGSASGTYAYGNTVTITGGTFTGKEFGGGKAGNVVLDDEHRGNTINISGGTFNRTVAESGIFIYGGESQYGPASYNKVCITGGKFTTKDDVGVFIDGGHKNGNGEASHNEVTVANATFATGVKIYGGYVETSVAHPDATANYNTVSLENVKNIKALYGGDWCFTTGSDPLSDSSDLVTGNTLNLSGINESTGTVGNFEKVNLQTATWGTPVLTASTFENITNIDASALKFTNPGAVNGTMNLLAMTGTATGENIGLDKPALVGASHEQVYVDFPIIAGVTASGILQGTITQSESALTYTNTANAVNRLTFGNVEWKDTGALIDHSTTWSNADFNGAAVDTTKINFTNIKSLEANKKMTLVKDFGDTVGTITGTEYTVGTTLKGKGQASLVGSDLIFAAETTAVSSSEDGGGELVLTTQEQTHNTLMGAAAGMAALSAGNDFVGAAAEGISLASNTGADGLATYANMGGGSLRQETGSHVDAHTWNAILAIGHRNAKERSTLDYGAFFEYGRGNYTTINGDQRGDGNTHYTGGGLMAKYALKNGVYAEASLRAGRMTDNASNVLRDALGNAYSYKTSTPYYGFHLGVGKVFDLGGGKTVDLYGKYFYNHRNSVSFDAGGQYDLDAVNSHLLRLGARYTLKRDSWNYYAGLAYEYELDGKATGTADGVPIRAASTKGGSLRGELGATFRPSEDSPWNIDLNVSGFAGKKRGVTGGVSVAYMF